MDDDLPRAERTALLLEAAASAPSSTERARWQERAIEINMPIAAQVAARYRGRGVPTEDLEQVAYLALVKSVQRYEYDDDRPFLSYAVPTIRGEVKRYFRDLGWTIRPTRSIQEAQARVRHGEGELWQVLGRAPRPSEISEHLGLDLDTVVEALAANGCFTPSSLDATTADGSSSVADLLPEAEDGFDCVETRLMLGPLVAGCSERERRMLEMRFLQHMTQEEIGEILGLSQMQVSRLLSSLMARLRDGLLSPQDSESVA